MSDSDLPVETNEAKHLVVPSANYLKIGAKFRPQPRGWFKRNISARTQAQEYLRDLDQKKQVVRLDSLVLGGDSIPYAGIIHQRDPQLANHPVFGKVYDISFVVAGPQEFLAECIERTVLGEDIIDSDLEVVDAAIYSFTVSRPYREGELKILQEKLEDVAEEEGCEVNSRKWSRWKKKDAFVTYYLELSTTGEIRSILRVKERIYPAIEKHVLKWKDNPYTSFKELPLDFYLQKS